jgi:hypothetical protein
MNIQLNSKIAAAAILGMLLFMYVRHDHNKWRRAGRDAFLAFENHRYDTQVVRERPVTPVSYAIFAIKIFGTYQLIALVVLKLLAAIGTPQEKSSPASQ